jgi:hypothetical protein
MRRRVLLPLFVCLAVPLGACVHSIEGRIGTGLQAAGLPPPVAACMAERWAHGLSIAQLRKLRVMTESIESQYRGRTLTLLGLVEAVSRVHDPEIIAVVSASAAQCAFR